MIFRLVAALFILLCISFQSAYATGGLVCEAHDKALKFRVSVDRSFSSSEFFNFKAQIQVLLKNLPKDLKTIRLDKKQLVHHWLHEKEAKLLIRWDQPVAGSFKEPGAGEWLLVIQAWRKQNDASTLTGSYELTMPSLSLNKEELGSSTVLKGRVICFAE